MIFRFNYKEVTEQEFYQLIENTEGNYSFSVNDGKDEYWFIKDEHGEFYLKNGKLHRDDGPAIEWGNGFNEYWENGNYISAGFE